MNDIDRRTVFVAGLAAASLISNATGAATGSPEAKLRELGIELPKVTAPVANYVPSARLGNIIFPLQCTATQSRWLSAAGQGGARRDPRTGQSTCAERWPSMLAALREAAGSLDKVVRFGRVFGMVNAMPNSPTTQR